MGPVDYPNDGRSALFIAAATVEKASLLEH